MRTITVQDDEFDELESENEDLKDAVSSLNAQLEETENELIDLRELWDNKDALLTRIGEL